MHSLNEIAERNSATIQTSNPEDITLKIPQSVKMWMWILEYRIQIVILFVHDGFWILILIKYIILLEVIVFTFGNQFFKLIILIMYEYSLPSANTYILL